VVQVASQLLRVYKFIRFSSYNIQTEALKLIEQSRRSPSEKEIQSLVKEAIEFYTGFL
jgi:hypothetical protein